jgi:hypothetical protein
MALPQFNSAGDLPEGIHAATIEEVIARFGTGAAQRKVVGERLQRIHELAASTQQVCRFVVFGSFVTAKAEPRDVDIMMLMNDDFDVRSVTGEAAMVFQHADADSHFGASVFWVRRSAAFGGEQSLLEHWQLKRDGGLRGIVEIVEDRE